ncbi:ECA polymerase [Klebsiella pneumoniae subsp. pneumoniae]|uniref:ECA polymerase n=1 Tax=Klebsiella pneumoniae subsp. pneumoniae TaxID=72407 RepID=A0A378AUR8_KLEPN|nr:ECA polymerase [Klebsiella pneumoniae subsp. pneumoniae]
MSWATGRAIAIKRYPAQFLFRRYLQHDMLAREGLDSFGSRVVFPRDLWYLLAGAKLLYWFLDSVGLIHKRVKPLSQPQV